MKKVKNKNLTSFADHLDQPYGKRGTTKREDYEQGFENFKLGVLIQEMREKQNLTQEQLAVKCGTTKSYISRIENNASDIRLSTLMRIVKEDLVDTYKSKWLSKGKHQPLTLHLQKFDRTLKQ